MGRRETWTTGDEIAFLKHLGRELPPGRWVSSRGNSLRNYINNMKHRTDWVDMDPVDVRAAALEMLGKEIEKAGKPTIQ